MVKRVISLIMVAFISLCANATAQDLTKLVAPDSKPSRADDNGTRPRTVKKQDALVATDTRHLNPADPISSNEEAAIQAQINSVYQTFYNSYRLGPGDIIGIYIDKHPEDSVERVTVSPVG